MAEYLPSVQLTIAEIGGRPVGFVGTPRLSMGNALRQRCIPESWRRICIVRACCARAGCDRARCHQPERDRRSWLPVSLVAHAKTAQCPTSYSSTGEFHGIRNAGSDGDRDWRCLWSGALWSSPAGRKKSASLGHRGVPHQCHRDGGLPIHCWPDREAITDQLRRKTCFPAIQVSAAWRSGVSTTRSAA